MKSDCNEQIAGSRSQISTLMQVNELKNHPVCGLADDILYAEYYQQYDLRAVLVHDGMVGREHSYAYLRDHASGKWYRACDAEMIEVRLLLPFCNKISTQFLGFRKYCLG